MFIFVTSIRRKKNRYLYLWRASEEKKIDTYIYGIYQKKKNRYSYLWRASEEKKIDVYIYDGRQQRKK
jgi:IS1 family transposase